MQQLLNAISPQAPDQHEVITFLSQGAAYGRPDIPVERIETHCSSVFLVGDRAYKLKHPVTFSSVDYATVAQREEACRAELRLNRRTAPDLYLGLHAIRRGSDGRLTIDGVGEAVEWIIAMQRFDRAALFDHMADAGLLTHSLLERLGTKIARFHDCAERTPAFGGADGLRRAIERNHKDQSLEAEILGRSEIAVLYQRSLGALDRIAADLGRRRIGGMVRRCHGDLRLANICLFHGDPTLFDAIEFSDELSCIDVLFDLAFLLMDLHHRRLDGLAVTLLRSYVATTGDRRDLAIMPLFLSTRAATRAYTLAGGVRRQRDETEANRRFLAARRHMTMALDVLVEPPDWLSIHHCESS